MPAGPPINRELGQSIRDSEEGYRATMEEAGIALS
jgi:hypothetical protein